MSWNLRKAVIGLASLGALIVVYWVVARSYQTPQIDVRPAEENQGLPGEALSRNPGRIGRVDVYGAGGVLYQDRDDQGRVYREWGFEDSWHRGNDVWEMKRPFVRLFLPDANCVVTADWGRFTMQHNQAFPTDASFSGHVTLQIQPLPGSDVPACRANLDDIAFVGTTSRFTCSGRIEFASDTVRWSGRQAEFVYNDQLRRIEYFHLAHLDGLTLKVSKGQSVLGPAAPAEAAADGRVGRGSCYQCLLRNHVTVQTALQAVFAEQYLLLTDLVWSQPSGNPGAKAPSKPEKDRTGASTGPAGEWTQISVTCDGPVVMTPNGAALPADPNGSGPEPAQPARKTPPSMQTAKDAAQFSAQSLRYSARTRDAVAEGPVELNFLARNATARDGQGLVPVRMTARQRSVYEAQANRIVLEGPCLCTLVRRQADVTEQCSLAAPRLIVDLLEARDGRPIGSWDQALKYLRTDGGTVELRIEAQAGGKKGSAGDAVTPPDGPVLSGAKMVCTRLDFDPQAPGQVITAVGPGTLWLNNSASQETGRLVQSNQPFYALLRQFETLRFLLADNRLVADGKSQPLLVDYFPIIEGQQDSHIRAEADSVQIDWIQTDRHERDLATLAATGNVYYDDQDHQFAAHKLVYDHASQWMDMAGSDNQPCSANGVAVRGIRFNVKTQQLQTQIVAPAMGLMR